MRLYEGTKHNRATDLLRQGVSERVLQELLRNRYARSTRRYARLARWSPSVGSPGPGWTSIHLSARNPRFFFLP